MSFFDRTGAGSRCRAGIVAGAVVVSLVVLTPQVAHADPQFPSWAEVQAAQRSASAKQAEIDKLTGLISQLEDTSARLGQEAVSRNEEYLQAQADLETATQRYDTLVDRAADAREKADASQKQAGRIIAQMARTGGGDVTAALAGSSAKDADRMLYKLGAMSRLSATSTEILDKARYDQKTAESLGDQASAAKAEREKRDAAAQDALQKAQDAFAAAEQQVASTKTQSDTAYAQLASLNQQSAAINQQYLQGVAYRQEQARRAAEEAARQKAAAAAAASHSASGSSSSGGSSAPASSGGRPISSVGSANGGVVAQAIAYARAQLGEPYALGAAGPSAWDCSGLTMMAYASAGVSIGGHGATQQYRTLRAQGKLAPISQIQPGDLVFYNDDGDPEGYKDHVAIYIGGGQLIEAPRPGVPVRIWSMYTAGRVPYVGRPGA